MAKSLSAIGRAGIDDDGFRAGTPTAAARRTWTATASRASVIYGPLSLGFPIDDPELQTRLLRRLERLGRRGVQRSRPDAAVRARVPPRPLTRGRGRRARAVRRPRSPRRDHRRVRHRPRRPGVGPAVGGGRADRPADQLPHPRRHVVEAAATGSASGSRPRSRRVLPLQLDEPLATMVFSRRARAASRAARSCSRSRASAGCPTSCPAWTWSGGRSRDKLDYATADRRRARCSAARWWPRSRRSHSPRSCIPLVGADSLHVGVRLPAHRQHVPELAPRDRGDARHAPRRGPPQDDRDELRPPLRLRRWLTTRGGSRASTTCRSRWRTTDAMVAFYRALGFDVAEHEYFVSVYAGAQMINLHRPSIWQREGFTLRAPAARPPCGDLCFVWDGSAGGAARAPGGDRRRRSSEGPVERPGRPARRPRRASTCATPTATSSSS